MKLVKFEHRSSSGRLFPVYVNPDQVTIVQTAGVDGNHSLIHVYGGVQLEVTATPDAVAEKIKEES